MGALESGKSLAEQILAKLPENLRGQVQTAFAAPEAVDALTLLGDSALARGDYSRQSDELKRKTEELDAARVQVDTDYKALTDWYGLNEAKLKQFDTIKPEYDRLKAGNPNPNPNPNPAPPTGVSEDAVAKMFQEREMAFARVLGLTSTLTAKHLNDFKEVLDVNALIEHATKHKVPLYDPRSETDAYRALHGEKLAAKEKAERDAGIEKIVQERLAAERRTQQGPYPVRGQEPSVLDTLQQPDRQNRYSVDSAVARYEELTQAAGARG